MSNDSFPRVHHNDMVDNKRYGKLVIQYEAGHVTWVRKEEVISSSKNDSWKRDPVKR